MIPALERVLADAVPFALPLRTTFRAVDRRVGLLIRGPAGWGEFAPFDNYPPPLASRWLAAALEAAYAGWPEPVRDEVPVNEIVPAVPAEELDRLGIEWGAATCAKVKVDGDLPADTARLAEVRRRLPRGARIRIDVNAGWTLRQALAQLPVLAAAAGGLEYVEQPLRSLDQIAALRAETGVPVAVDETLRLAPDPFDRGLLDRVRAAADVAVLKPAPLGGVAATLRLAEELAMPVVISGAMDSSVGLCAGIAAAAALPSAPLPCGLGTGRLLAADVVAEPLLPIGGALRPTRAGPDRLRLAAARDRVSASEALRLRQRLIESWEYL